jgi:hypothetical protein
MAKKADANTTTTWISLFEARELVVSAYGAVRLAEELLEKWLGEERVRWSCKLLERPSASDLAALRGPGGVSLLVADVAYSEGDPAFWRTYPEINWEESWARENKYVVGGTAFYGITAAREDVLALVPKGVGEHEEAAALPRQHRSGKRLIEAEAKRRAAEGERWDSITALSEDLHEWMKTVNDEPLEPRTIENYLRGELWSLFFKK